VVAGDSPCRKREVSAQTPPEDSGGGPAALAGPRLPAKTGGGPDRPPGECRDQGADIGRQEAPERKRAPASGTGHQGGPR